MNELMTILQNRHSVRHYTGEPIPEEFLQMILQAALLSPTGRNFCPWEFIVVRDKQVLQEMAKCRTGSANMLTEADCAVVVVADTTKSDTVIEDCSIAMSNMHLMADSLGVGSCWIQGRMRQAQDGRSTEEFLRSLLHFPEHYCLEATLSLGMPVQKREPKALDSLDQKKIHDGAF